MRAYPTNSPEAAARIVALAMLADGHLCRSELDVIERLDAHSQLGLQLAELHNVVRAVCEDLLSTSNQTWQAACRVDAVSLAEILAEIDGPDLRVKVLGLLAAVTVADEHMSAGEIGVLTAAFTQWRQPAEPAPKSHCKPDSKNG